MKRTVIVSGTRLRAAMAAAGFTASAEFARRCDVANNTTRRIIRSDQPVNVYQQTAERMAEVLGVDLAEILA